MNTPLWVTELAREFWMLAGGAGLFPRDLRSAAPRAALVSVKVLADLSVQRVSAWLGDQGVASLAGKRERALRACLFARDGCGFIFLDAADDEAEQRFHSPTNWLITCAITTSRAAAPSPSSADGFSMCSTATVRQHRRNAFMRCSATSASANMCICSRTTTASGSFPPPSLPPRLTRTCSGANCSPRRRRSCNRLGSAPQAHRASKPNADYRRRLDSRPRWRHGTRTGSIRPATTPSCGAWGFRRERVELRRLGGK